MKRYSVFTIAPAWILFAATLMCQPASADEPVINAEIFIAKASAKGIAELEAGHLALRESSNRDVENFAQTMISDHGAIHREVVRLAKQKGFVVAEEADLINQAKLSMMKVRDGESFDMAYARNQVTTHEETIALFHQAAALHDMDISNFAEKHLPILQEHLEMATRLVQKLTPPGTELPPRKTFDIPAHDEQTQPPLQPAPKEINPGEQINTH